MKRDDVDRWLRVYDNYRSQCIKYRYLYNYCSNTFSRRDIIKKIIIADKRLKMAASKLNIEYNPYTLL